jgi:hypothetical protein
MQMVHTHTETACDNIDWRDLMTNHSCSQFVTACPCQLGRLWQEVLAAFVYISVDYRMLFKDIRSCSKLSKMFPPICFISFHLDSSRVSSHVPTFVSGRRARSRGFNIGYVIDVVVAALLATVSPPSPRSHGADWCRPVQKCTRNE